VIALTFAAKMILLGAIASDAGVMLLVSINEMKILPRKHNVDMELQSFQGKKECLVDLQYYKSQELFF